MRNSLSIAGLLAAAALTSSASAQVVALDLCGDMAVDGGGCLQFYGDDGLTYQPGIAHSLSAGDRVRFVGDSDPVFFGFCFGPIEGLLVTGSFTFDAVCDPVTTMITVQCDPAGPHYQGNSAKLNTSSFGSGVGSDLHIECTDGPSGEFGFMLMSADGSANASLFNGVLCLGSPFGRYNANIATNQGLPQLNSLGQFDASGVLQNLAGTATSSGGSGFDVPSELPLTPAGQMIAPGDTYYFQVWFRDQVAPLPNPGSSANFSNMIEVLF